MRDMPPLTRALYREHPPSPPLASFVACFWTLRGRADDGNGRAVVPDACVDVLFDLAAARSAGSAAGRVVGTMTVPLSVRSRGMLDILAVRFRPGGGAPFLGVPAHEITDGVVDLDDVWGAPGTALWRRLAEASDTGVRLRLLDDALLHRLGPARAAADHAVLGALGLAERAAGSLDVDTLAHSTGLGRRQLERRFLRAVGIPPRTASRVLRFQKALSIMHRAHGTSLASVAVAAGYHDQPHLTHDFRTLAGQTPGAYRRALAGAAGP